MNEEKKELIEKLNNLVDIADYMKNSYFFSPPRNPEARKSYEERYSTELIKWEESGNSYSARYTTECRGRCVYAWGRYRKNGEKTNLKAIKYSLKRLEEDYKKNDDI
ncbi:MAG: hypothetical protein E7312_02625 [Clostridiales bacterium]|nr:hypothetical protein [Clostridiales bacterium]